MANEIPENIDRFNRLVLATLSLLYKHFPKRIDIDAHVLGVTASGDNFEDGEDGHHRAFTWMGAADDTITWLAEEGFIRTDGLTTDRKHIQVVLTGKGLRTMGHVPQSVKENPEHASIGTLASKTLKSGAKEVISDVVKEIISLGAKIVMTQSGLS